MSIKFEIYNNQTNIQYDVSNLILSFQLSTYLEDQPGTCKFTMQRDTAVAFKEGATVSIKNGDLKIFKGYVFVKKLSKNKKEMDITAYDQLRYLKYNDSYVFSNKTSDQIFAKICEDQVLKYKVVDKSTYICTPRINDNKPLYDIIRYAIHDTLINTKSWFVIRDNYGVLEHINILSLQAKLVLGDDSAVNDYTYESTIDKDVYNQIKLYRDNTKSGHRDIYIVNDTVNGGANLKNWGILQLYQKVDDGLNKSQIQEKAFKMLELYNESKKTMVLACMGDFSIFAGRVVRCKFKSVDGVDFDRFMLVSACTHNIKGDSHDMNVTVEVIR